MPLATMSRCRVAWSLPALALLLGGCAALSDAKLVTLGAEYWDAQPGGSIQSSDLGMIGDLVDVDDALSLDKERVWVYHAAATVGPTVLEASFLDLGFSGLSTLASGFSFGGGSFDPADIVSSDLDTSVLQIHTATGFFNWNVIRFGFIAGIDQVVIDSKIIEQGGDLDVGEQEFDDWIPVIGLTAGAKVPLWKVELFADGEVSGMLEAISFDSFDGDYISAMIRGGVNIDEGFKIGLGYRSIEFDFEDGGDDTKLDLGGAFVFLELNF